MIGKILTDRWGWTEKLGGTENETIHITTKVNNKELDKLKKDIQDCNTTAQVDVVIKEQGLEKIEGLPEHIKEVYEKGEIDKLQLSDVNKFALNQRYKDIADQAHGFTGVNVAIKEYNDGIKKGTLDTTKFAETISQSNSSLGNYLTKLDGAKAGIFDYGKSLATATIKSFALEAATMALNTAVSFGASLIISGIITAVTDYLNRVVNAIEASHRAKEAINEANSTLKEQQNLIKESGRKYAELAQHVNQLNNTNLDLKEEEYAEFLNLSNQIAEQFPDLVKGYDENGNAILSLNGTVSDINSTLDTYIEKAKEASQVKIVQAFKGEGDNEDYFKGAKYEIDELNSKATNAKTEIENLQKFKEKINLHKDDLTDWTSADLFGNYANGTDARLKSDYVRKYLESSGLDEKLQDKHFQFGLEKYFSDDEVISFNKALNDRSIDGRLSDSAILTIDDILSMHSKESGYNISDYITKQINQQIKTATDNYDQFAKDVETKNKEISQNAQAVLEQSVIWSNPDTTEQMKTTMTNALSKIDWSDAQFEGFDGEQAANYIQTTFASSFEKLSDNDKITVDKFFNADPKNTDITQYINLYEKNKEIFEKQGINIPINIEDVQNVENDFNKSLEQMSDKDKETVKKYLADNSIDSVSELDVWNKRTEGITNATEAISAYEKKAKEVSKINSATDSIPSFSEKWNKLKESEQNSLKNEVLEGVLDKESISQYQDLADNFSLEQIRNEILSLIPLDEKLSQFIDDSEKLTSAYTEMKKNKTVSTKTLLGMPEGIRRLDGYTDFRNTVADPKSSKESKKGAFEDIITEYLNANQTIVDTSDKTKNYVVNALKDAGITNAEALVNGVINCKDTINKVMDEIEGANETDVKNFAKVCTSKNLNNTKLYNKIGENTASMLNQLKDKYADDVRNFGNSLQIKLKAEKQYASAVLQLEAAANGGTSNAVMPNFFGKSNVSKDSKEYKEYLKKKKALDKANKDYKKNLAKLKKDLKKVSIAEIDIDFDPSGKKKEKKKSTKETKTEIDWLSRRLTRMQSIIDLTASKLQNLFSIKAKTGNVNDQIKQTTTLMEQYGIAAKRYQDKADSIAEGYTTKIKSGKNKGKKKKVKPLPKSIINQIKSGKITKKSYPKLIKKYGQSYADRINKYIDYYDKAQDAKEKEQDAETKVRNLKQQNLQYYVDDYNAKANLAEINSGNAVGYQKQNSFISTQLSCLQKSYEKQIAIAKLSEDKTEQDRLQAEYEAKKVELKQKQIENLKTDFENKISFTRNDEQDVRNRISEIEARGDIVQSSYYSALNRYEQSALNSMKTELQELKKEQNSFAKYSPEWYSLQSDIQSVENSISETNISIIENNKKIGELRQSMYDDIASHNNNAGSEAQFLAGLLGDNLFDDKTGSMTKEGLGVLGTYGIELEANTNTALSYKKDREEIEQAIAAFNSGNVHALDSYGSLNAAEKKLSDVIKTQQEAISAEYNSMKNIYDLMVKRYDTQLAYMKSIIDAKKQVLSMEKDLYDYQKNISSQTKNIAALEKQLAALKGDDSEEGRAKRSKLQVNLDEANQELQDTEYERYISDQENMLDNMYTQYEDLLSELEKDFEAVVKDGLNIIDTNASSISTTLNEIADKYGYNPSTDMKEILSVMQSSNGTIVNTLPGTITNGLSELGRIFQEGANAIVAAYSGKTPVSGNNSDTTDGGGSGGGSNSNGGTERFRVENTSDSDSVKLQDFLSGLSGANDITKPLKRAKKNKTYESELNQKLSQYGYVVKTGTGTHGLSYINMFAQALGLKSGDGSYSSKGAAYKALKKKYPAKFRTGGIVRAKNVPKDGDFVPVRVNPDETILTQDFTKLLPGAVDTMKDFIKVPDYAGMAEPRQMGNTFGDIVINTELPNVKDSYDFANDLQNNRRTQRAIEVGVHDLMKQGKFTSNIQRF